MNKRLLLVLLLSLPFLASAQTWQGIVQGGLSWNSTTNDFKTSDHHPWMGGMGAAGCSYRNKHIEVGLIGGYRRYAFRIEGDEYGFDPLTGYATSTSRHYRFIEKLPAVFTAPFINYHFGKEKLDLYAGASGAYLRFYGSQDGRDFNLSDGGNGYSLDLRGGFAYPLTKAISLFSEISVGALYFPVYFRSDAYMYTGSLSVGAKMKL